MFQVRRAPRRRGAPRPNQNRPHVIRPVEDITEDELQLVADNMTHKVYNSVTVRSQLNLNSFWRCLKSQATEIGFSDRIYRFSVLLSTSDLEDLLRDNPTMSK